MKFEFDKMVVRDRPALFALLQWLDKQSLDFDDESMTVFVDGSGDFCAVEYVSRPYEHTSRAHSLLELVTSPYVPVVVPLWMFRQRVNCIAVAAIS